jgi:flavorubredoxin
VHTAGSFITYDVKTRTAFTSDIFGSYSTNDDWELFMALFPECYKCKDKNVNACILKKKYCPVSDIIDFHRIIGTSEKALKYAVNMIFREKIDIIAPQHGSVITSKEDIEFLKDVLINLNDVGIDYIIKDGNNNEK